MTVVLVLTARATRSAIEAARAAAATLAEGPRTGGVPARAARTALIDAAGTDAVPTDTVPDPVATAAAVPGAELRSAA